MDGKCQEFMNSPLDDFELIDAVCCRLVDKEREMGAERLAPEERVVCYIWGALGLLGNGSFQYFFENEMDPDAVAESLDLLGFPSIAACFRETRNLFPEQIDQSNWDQTLAFMQQHESEFDSLAVRVLQSEKQIQASLATYIRSRPDFFVEGSNSIN